MITTYDFGSKTFGHASMLVGPMEVFIVGADGKGGKAVIGDKDPGLDAAMAELAEARKRLVVEQEKERKGEPFDMRFIYGCIIDGSSYGRYEHVGGRLYRLIRKPKR
ncbi:MAG: hypothetical protein WC683_04240 [bacterium]